MPPFVSYRVPLLWLAALLLAGSLRSEIVYLDTNGASPGSGEDGSGNITTNWDSLASLWNSDSAGGGAGTTAWTAGNLATFSAGSGATGTINVTVGGTHSLSGLTVNQGTVNLLGSGILTFADPSRVITIGAGLTTIISARISGAGTTALTKAGLGTLVLGNGGNDFTGPTLIQAGTLKMGVNNALPVGTDLYFGTTDASVPVASVGGLDLSSASLTVRTLNVFSNTAAVNEVTIGAGQALQVSNNVTIGPNQFVSTTDPSSTTVTRMTISGAGEFVVAGTGNRVFSVGGVISTPAGYNANRGNSATLDLSGLAKFTADLGSGGTFRVGDPSTNSSPAVSTLLLAAESVIKAGTFTTATQNVSATPSSIVKLGSTSTVIQSAVITIGMGGARAFGTLDFQTSTGTLKIRGYNGGENDRAAMSVGYGAGSTSNSGVGGTVNLTGHSADLKLSTLQIAGRTGTAGGGVKETAFSFNLGTLDVTSVQLGYRGGSTTVSSGTVIGVLNLGSAGDAVAGNVIIGAGGLTVSTNEATMVQATNRVTSTVNIAGLANVSIGATGGTSITLGNAATVGYVATATLNFNGGTTVAGDIIKGAGAGFATVTSTVTLAGGSLDMSGRAIGNVARPINSLNFRSGTLMNVSDLNGGADLIKTTAGTLVLTGTNTYGGGTQVQAGVLQVGVGQAGQTGAGSTTVSAGATLAGTGTVQGAATVNGAAGNLGLLKPGDSAGSGLGVLAFGQSLSLTNHAQAQLQIQSATLNDPDLLAAFAAGSEAYNAYLSDHIAEYESATLNPAAHDFLEIAGVLSMGTGTNGGVVRVESSSYVPQAGDVFNLMDWSGLLQGGFTTGGATVVSGGQAGDLYLPTLSGYSWDLSLFTAKGLLLVVPEPSRGLLLLFASVVLLNVRRRPSGDGAAGRG